jgi:uncharacterized protein DUF3147
MNTAIRCRSGRLDELVSRTLKDLLLRFLIGGVAVSAFAVLGDVCRPKSFAGLFGAAPSIAISTLAIALYTKGTNYTAVEGRSMMIGSIAFCLYGAIVCYLLQRSRWHALPAAAFALIGWAAAALGGKWALLG